MVNFSSKLMLARIQQVVTISLLAMAALWTQFWWGSDGLTAVLGGLVILFAYAVLLAVGFFALLSFNRHDPAGAPPWAGLFRVWWLETRIVMQVFFLEQPFRSESIDDYLPQNDRRGVVFIHGLVCNRGLWTPWLKELRAQGHAFIAVNLEPVFGSIDDYAVIVDLAVRRVSKCTGLPPVLVCHSMGGVAARAWLRNASTDVNVHRIVTIGTPHHGTRLARYGVGRNGSQMRLNSKWLKALEAQEAAQGYARFICWYSNGDNVVIPATTGSLQGADNRHIPSVGHVALAFCPEVVSATLSMITDTGD